MKIRKNLLWLSLIAVMIIAAAFFLLKAQSSASVINNYNKDENAQIIKMHVEGSSYVLEPSTLKKDKLVRIEADISRLPGCSRSVVIPDFNIRKNLNENDNIIEFTPDKTGTFSIMCSMNMYRGTFKVE